jgi:hypothetical protein
MAGLPRSLYPVVASYFVSGFKSKNLVQSLMHRGLLQLRPCVFRGVVLVQRDISSLCFEQNLIAYVISTAGVCVCRTYRPRFI